MSLDVDAEDEGRFAHVVHLVLLGELSLNGVQFARPATCDEQVVDVQCYDGDAVGFASDVHAAIGMQWCEAVGQQ